MIRLHFRSRQGSNFSAKGNYDIDITWRVWLARKLQGSYITFLLAILLPFTMSTTEREERHRSSKQKDRDREKDKHRSRDKDRDRNKDTERKHKKRRKHEDDHEGSGRQHKHRRKEKGDKAVHLSIVDDDVNDDDMWVEKNIDMEGERVRVSVIYVFAYAS